MASGKTESVLPDFTQTVSKIWQIVQDDDKLEAFDLISSEEMLDEYQSPLRYENHNVALERGCIKQLSLFVYHRLFQRSLDVENQKAFLTTALLLNCNVKTFWNMRRELVLQNQLEESVELRYVNFVLSFWPKCSDAIFYRKWLLREKLIEKPLKFMISELNQIHGIADHRENNLLLWDYCTWLHEQCQFHSDFATFSHSAWNLSSQYMSTHPSDASHINYRQRIIRRFIYHRDRLKNLVPLIKESAVKEGFMDLDDDDTFLIGIIIQEFGLNKSLMDFWANYEGIWSHQRFLTWCWFNILPNLISCRGKVRVQQVACCPENDCPFRTFFLSRIQPQFSKIGEGNPSFAQRYNNWINTFL